MNAWRHVESRLGATNSLILAAIFSTAGGTIAARLSLVLREVTFAYLFGAGRVLDIILIAFVVPTYVTQVLTSGIPATFIPAAVGEQQQRGPQGLAELIGSFTWLVLGGLAAACLVSAIGGSLYIAYTARDLGSNSSQLGVQLLFLFIPFVLFRGVEILWAACLNLHGFFALAAIVPALTPLLVSGALLLISGEARPYAVAAVTSAGLALECTILAGLLRRHGIPLRPRWTGFSPALRTMMTQYAPIMAGMVLFSATLIVDQYSASQLAVGSVSQLYFATLVVSLPILIGTTVIGTAALPYVSQLAVRGEWAALAATVRSWVLTLLALSLVGTGILFVIAPFVVSLLFERGAFSPSDAAVVTQVVRALAWQIPFSVAGAIVVQVVYAMRRTEVLLIGAAGSLLIKTVLNAVLLQRFGLVGIGISTVVMYAFSSGFSLYFLSRGISARAREQA